MFSTLKTKRRANTPQRGTALPRTGVFHVNPPVRSSVGNPMDSHQEVSTSWDALVYPKCSDSISEPRESLNCYITLQFTSVKPILKNLVCLVFVGKLAKRNRTCNNRVTS